MTKLIPETEAPMLAAGRLHAIRAAASEDHSYVNEPMDGGSLVVLMPTERLEEIAGREEIAARLRELADDLEKPSIATDTKVRMTAFSTAAFDLRGPYVLRSPEQGTGKRWNVVAWQHRSGDSQLTFQWERRGDAIEYAVTTRMVPDVEGDVIGGNQAVFRAQPPDERDWQVFDWQLDDEGTVVMVLWERRLLEEVS